VVGNQYRQRRSTIAEHLVSDCAIRLPVHPVTDVHVDLGHVVECATRRRQRSLDVAPGHTSLALEIGREGTVDILGRLPADEDEVRAGGDDRCVNESAGRRSHSGHGDASKARGVHLCEPKCAQPGVVNWLSKGRASIGCEPMRVAIVGAGGMGSFHARSLASLPDVEIVAVADVRESAARALSDAVGGKPTTDALGVAAMPDLDGLVIASPEDSHEALAMAAFGQGTPVLCEKPLAVGVAACQRIVDAEVAMGHRLLQLGLMRVYDRAHVQFATEVAELGELHHIRCVHRNVHQVRRTAQLILNQSLVHDIHSLRWLANRQIVRVTTLVTPNPEHVDHLLVTAEFDGGGHATIEFSEHSFAYEVSVEVEAQLGGAVMAPVMRTTVRRDGSSGVNIGTDWFERFAEAYRIEDSVWLDSLVAGAAVGPSAWDGLVAERVVEAAIESLRRRQPVEVTTLDTPDPYR
jgi:myo-inositol 2-dehydrogenase/D-chiro-inositol 1-dehydrogenase